MGSGPVVASLLDGAPDLGTWRPGATALGLLARPGLRSLPDRLDLLRRADGSPWFGLALGRYADLSDAADGVGFLDLGVDLRPAAGTAGDPPVGWQDGWLTIEVADILGAPTAVTAPVSPVGPTSLSCLIQLDIRTALLLRSAVVDRAALTLRATATVRIPGVAARAAHTADLDLGAVAARLGAPGLTRTEVVALVTGLDAAIHPDADPSAGPDAARDVGDALADRFLARFADAVPPAAAAAEVRYVARPGVIGTARWDLRQPVAAHRFAVLDLDPLGSLRAALAGADPAVLVRTDTVRPLDDGRRAVTVHDTIAPTVDGIDRLEVHVVAPPRPPHRVQASTARVTLHPRSAAEVADPVAALRLSPVEPFGYTWRTVALPAAPAPARFVAGPVRTGQGPAFRVTPADVPVRWAPLSAGDALTAHGRVEVTATWTGGDGAPLARTVVLEAARPAVQLAVPVPADADDPGLALTATLVDPGRAARVGLGARPVGAWHLDADDVPGLGAQTAVLECDVPDGGVTAVEVRPADGASPTPPAVLAFTATNRRHSWPYVATSPFATGVRTRPWTSDGDPAPWSEPYPPGAPVVLTPAQVLR